MAECQSLHECLNHRHREQVEPSHLPSHIDCIPPIDRRGKRHLVMYPQLQADDREGQHLGAGGVGECEYAGRSPVSHLPERCTSPIN